MYTYKAHEKKKLNTHVYKHTSSFISDRGNKEDRMKKKMTKKKGKNYYRNS